MSGDLPLLRHPLDRPTGFSPEALVAAVRKEKGLETLAIPEVCVLEFDGDLTDWLVAEGIARPYDPWACFHTTMFAFDVDGAEYGIVARTIGGPFAVLIAEQMAVSGARLVLGLTSAGRVSPKMPVPGLAVASRAIRDEGTSFHYAEPSAEIDAPKDVVDALVSELKGHSLATISGTVWTTDAPYRETNEQLAEYARMGVLAVEMQAASLFAFSAARNFPVGLVAHVTNGIGLETQEFEKGSRELQFDILKRMCKAGRRISSVR